MAREAWHCPDGGGAWWSGSVWTIVNLILSQVFFALGMRRRAARSRVIWIGVIVLHIMCIVKGLNGQRLIVPGVSEYANRF